MLLGIGLRGRDGFAFIHALPPLEEDDDAVTVEGDQR
jgi:hypothetical protein